MSCAICQVHSLLAVLCMLVYTPTCLGYADRVWVGLAETRRSFCSKHATMRLWKHHLRACTHLNVSVSI